MIPFTAFLFLLLAFPNLVPSIGSYVDWRPSTSWLFHEVDSGNTKLETPPVSANYPAPRSEHLFIAIDGSTDILLAGGTGDADTWLYHTTTGLWEFVDATERWEGMHGYSPISGYTAVFGGIDKSLSPKSEVSVFSLAAKSWTVVGSPGGTPPWESCGGGFWPGKDTNGFYMCAGSSFEMQCTDISHFLFSDVDTAQGSWQTQVASSGWGAAVEYPTMWEDYSSPSAEHLYSFGGTIGATTYTCLFHIDIANSVTWDSLIPDCTDGLFNQLRYGPIDYSLSKRTHVGEGRAVIVQGYAYLFGGTLFGPPAPTRGGAFSDMWRVPVEGLYDYVGDVSELFEWVWVTDVDTRMDVVATFDGPEPRTPGGRIWCGFAGLGNRMYVHGGIQVISDADVERADLWSIAAGGVGDGGGKFMFCWWLVFFALAFIYC